MRDRIVMALRVIIVILSPANRNPLRGGSRSNMDGF